MEWSISLLAISISFDGDVSKVIMDVTDDEALEKNGALI